MRGPVTASFRGLAATGHTPACDLATLVVLLVGDTPAAQRFVVGIQTNFFHQATELAFALAAADDVVKVASVVLAQTGVALKRSHGET